MITTLPNFLMIGAPRTGSTALDQALRQHPQIFLPDGKETHFFSAGADASLPQMRAIQLAYRVTASADEYAQCFVGAAPFPLRGEIDPSILSHAAYAIPKLRACLGSNLRLIVVLRQPVERAYSHYLLHTRYGFEPRAFESYIDVVKPRAAYEIIALDRYFQPSFYFETLKVFLDEFGRERFLILLYDDLKDDARAFMIQVLQFLNADLAVTPALPSEINAGRTAKNFRARLQFPHHPLRQFARRYMPKFAQQVTRRAVGLETPAPQQFVKPALKAETRARLLPRYRDDILRTQDLIPRDLSHWLK
jgi:hypothetical protein